MSHWSAAGNFCPFIGARCRHRAAGGYFSAAHYSAPRCAPRHNEDIYFCATAAAQIMEAAAISTRLLDAFKHLMTNSGVMMIDFYCHLQRGHAPPWGYPIQSLAHARARHQSDYPSVIMTAATRKSSYRLPGWWLVVGAFCQNC